MLAIYPSPLLITYTAPIVYLWQIVQLYRCACLVAVVRMIESVTMYNDVIVLGWG